MDNLQIIARISEKLKHTCGSCKWCVESYPPHYVPALRKYSRNECKIYDYDKENECISENHSLWEFNVCIFCVHREATVLDVVWGCHYPCCTGFGNEKNCLENGMCYFKVDYDMLKKIGISERDICVTEGAEI